VTDLSKLTESLPRQRWFGHKGRAITGVSVVDEAIIEDGPPALIVALARVDLEDGSDALYQLPLLVDEDGTVRDGTEDVERMRVFGDLMAHGSSIKGSSGVFQFGGPGLDPLASPPGETSIRLMAAEQSNSSVVLDETIILKLFRQVAIGPNPDLELNRLLTNEGFEHVPPQVGEALYEGEIDGSDVSIDLAVAQQFVTDGVEGWQEALARLGSLYDEVDDEDAGEDRAFLTEERAGEFLRAIEQLGDATASLHVLLSREEIDTSLVPEPIGESDIVEWADRVAIDLARLQKDLPEELGPMQSALDARVAAFRAISPAGLKTRIHGDYHLGQVLLTPRGWRMLDFEGEPARSLDQRRAKQSPLRDVAGMLRSFSYAACSALMERAAPGSPEWARLEPWADAWESLARDRFLAAYVTRAHEAKFLPPDREEMLVTIDAFEIDKALYEIAYERSHRPDWMPIPLRGLERAATRVPR
jgi:maltose alpha-D-glucosyltransferase / alpha-amylase